MAEKLLKLCLETAQHFPREGGGKVMNRHQCDFLMRGLQRTHNILKNIDKSQVLDLDPVLVLQELLQTLLAAQMRIEASHTSTISQWPRAAIEQGDMKDTFSKLLYDVEWHTSVLQSMLADDPAEFTDKCFSESNARNDFALRTAMEKDEENLKQLLRSVKVADPFRQILANLLRYKMVTSSPDLLLLQPDDFDHKVVGFVGSGGFGTVVETIFLGRECAMKIIKGGSGSEVNLAFETEMNAVKKLGHHPNLVCPFCYFKTHDTCHLIMEKLDMDLGKALQLKRRNGGGLSMVEAVTLMLEIGEGVKYIHSKGVAHRDLKPGNILINLRDGPTSKDLSSICSVKIADFGLTKTKEAIITCSQHTRNMGTSLYMAPEVMKFGKDDPGIKARFNPAKSDIFSLGIVYSEILTGEAPYGGLLTTEMKKRVQAGTLRPNLPTECPPRLTTLIKQCWAGNYEERPLITDICRVLRFIKGLLLMYSDRARPITKEKRTLPV